MLRTVKKIHLFGLGLFCSFLTVPALAHTTFEVQQAPLKSYYKGVLRAAHGCDGSPTLKLRVQIPEGVVSVKPMPKSGWTLETVTGTYEKPFVSHGRTITQGIKEITWTGKLLSEHYDEFVFTGFLSDYLQPDTTIYFPVVHECEKGTDRWIETPQEGKKLQDYRYPAPALKILPPKPKD